VKIQLFPFTLDLRNDEQRQQYERIEQRRADAWLQIYLARLQGSQILRGQVNTELPGMLRRQAD